MRSKQILTILAVAAGSLMAVNASAGTFGAGVYGAFNTHAMGDLNDAIDILNGAGADINNVENGFTGGLDLRLWASPNFMITGGWEPMFSSIKDESGAIPGELKMTTHAVTMSGAYYFPTPGTARYGIGAGMGYYLVGGEDTAASTELEGSGFGFHFMGLSEWTVSPGMAVTGGAGYRIAKIDDVTIGGVDFTELDYSGFMARLGLAFYMPQAN